jgi:transcriptional regulator of acetoin/glycerol metabolism
MPSGNPRLSALFALAQSGDDDARDEAIEAVATALRNNDGSVTLAAEELGVIRATIYRWMKEHPVLVRVRAKAAHDAIEQAKREGRV